ncbi:MAG: hypothetical protein H6672_10640 [Anaerolineaceae bacterium]|nr:hypothetical protein [Anaerolineaceae bacterium]
MDLQGLLNTTYQAFQEQISQARILLLHPRSRYRSVMVAQLLNTPDYRTFYYAMGHDDINLPSFVSGLTHDLANQHPTFGRHTNTLLPEDYEKDLSPLLDAFTQDLAEISDDPFLLILDEYDRSDSADDIQLFVEKLVGWLPDNCRLVLNSRTLPRLPWVSLIARRWAVLLEDNELIRSNFYGLEREGKDKLIVSALGPGGVLINGTAVDNWEGHLPRLLFFFALDKPVITRSEICRAFWPELDTDQAVNVFHVTKRRLHKAMDSDSLVHEDGYYCVNPDMDVEYDIIEFVTALMAGRDETNPNRVASWQKVIELYKGPFLQGHTDSWITERRADYQAGYLEALIEMARVRLADERPEAALSLFQRALAEDGSYEDIHREVMQLFAHMGRRSEAAAHFQKMEEDYKKQGWLVSDETRQLYQSIMS